MPPPRQRPRLRPPRRNGCGPVDRRVRQHGAVAQRRLDHAIHSRVCFAPAQPRPFRGLSSERKASVLPQERLLRELALARDRATTAEASIVGQRAAVKMATGKAAQAEACALSLVSLLSTHLAVRCHTSLYSYSNTPHRAHPSHPVSSSLPAHHLFAEALRCSGSRPHARP